MNRIIMQQTIQKHFETQIEIKKSRFLSTLVPVSDFDTVLHSLKEAYPKASHHIYAWRKLNEFRQVVENQSDDGEPKGSSGKPTLSVMAGKQIVDAAIITTRWFGGIKLGVGGLVRAYSESAKAVIEIAEFVPVIHRKKITAKVTYSELKHFEYLIQSFDCQNQTQKQFHSDHILIHCFIPEQEADRFESLFAENNGVSITTEKN